MQISDVARKIAPSPTLALNAQARQLSARGEPVIHLGAGEPKNLAPIAAILSAAGKLKEGDIKYTPTAGIPSLRKAIVGYTEQSYQRTVAPEHIVVSNGAKQAVWNVLYSLLNPQDEVIILAPYWVSYPEMVRMVYAVPVIVTAADGSFCPSVAEIKKVVSDKTRAIIVNSPNNPSGAVFGEKFMAELVDFCETKDIWLICDDIYHKLIFAGVQWPSPYQFTKKSIEDTRLITINGVSKLFGMTGFRIGWSVTSRALAETIANVQAQTTSTSTAVAQAAAEGALLGMSSHTIALCQMLQNNRDVMLSELKAFRGVKCRPPDGTFYCLPDFSAYGSDSVQLSKLLLDKARVVTVPGKEFGMEGHLRLSICGTIKEIRQGVERIKWALDPESPSELYIGDKKLVRDWL